VRSDDLADRLQRIKRSQRIRKRGADLEDPATGLPFWLVLAAPGLVALLLLAAVFSIEAAVVILVAMALVGAGALLLGEHV
jgi:Flp pilus assembly protein TadB